MTGKQNKPNAPRSRRRGKNDNKWHRLALYAICGWWGVVSPFQASIPELESAIRMILLQMGDLDPEIPDNPMAIAAPVLKMEGLTSQAKSLAGAGRTQAVPNGQGGFSTQTSAGGAPLVLGQTVASSAAAKSLLDDGVLTPDEAMVVAANADSQGNLGIDPATTAAIMSAAAENKDVSVKQYAALSSDSSKETIADNFSDLGHAIKGKSGVGAAIGDLFKDAFTGGGWFGKIKGRG